MSLRIADTTRILEVRSLDFDTCLFGAKLGSIIRSGQALVEPPEFKRLLHEARTDGYAHLIFRAAAEDVQSIWAAEQAGLKLVDIGIDSTFTFGRTPVPEQPPTPAVRTARQDDVAPLQDLAATAFVRSRFVVDPFFSSEANVLLHREWVKNLFGGLAQAIFVCEIDGQVAGFVSNSIGHGEARIPLIATNPGYRRQGIGRALIAAALNWSAQQGVPFAHVKTQAHNYPALALYHRAGYVVSKTELTFSVTLTSPKETHNMTKRVLVTGGAGYLGSVLVPQLLDEGYEVTVFDRLLFGREPLAAVIDHPRMKLIEGDITKLGAHNGFLEGMDAVIHLAAFSNDPSCDLQPELTQRVNFEATTELARRAARAGVRRFIYASSCSVYGSNPSPIVDEHSELHPVSLYAQKKAEAEAALFALPAPGMSITAFRMATLYGLSPRMRFDLAINLMVMNAVTRRAIYVLGGGHQWRPFVHVVDASQAYITALKADTQLIDRETFNVGADDTNYQIQELAWVVRDALPELEVSVTMVPDNDDKRSYRVGFSKIQDKLGYVPRCDLKESIVEIARAIQSGRLGDCSDSKFYTVKRMKELTEQPAMAGGEPIRGEFLPFALPLIGREEEEEVLDCLRSGWMTTGPKVQRFEKQLAEYAGAKHAIAVNSCTAALHIALAAAGIKRGDEVITSAITFPATANVIIHQGAKPILVDVDPTTLNIDPAAIEAAITPRTKAIIPVHMAGQACDMEAIYDIARRHNLKIIEDAAHAIGTEYRGERVGALNGSLAACYSFYPIKAITTIEGGAILTNDDDFADLCRLYALHGISKDAWKRYSNAGYQHWDTLLPGFKYNMTDVSAAMGVHQVPRLEGFLQTRERYANLYRDALGELPEIEVLRRTETGRHAWHLYVILLNLDKLSISRDQFMEALRLENIGTGIHFRSLHIQPYYAKTYKLKRDDMPHAAAVSDRLLSLPLYPKMTERDVLDVIEAVRKIVAHYSLSTNGHSEAPRTLELRTAVTA